MSKTRIITLVTEKQLLSALLKVGKRLAWRCARTSEPCMDEDVLEWDELFKAYNRTKRVKK